MPQGTPHQPTERAKHRNEMIKVLITLNRGQLEDLELIGRYRHGQRSRSVLVREAVGWLVAREAMSLVRYRDAEVKRKQREAEEARALIISSTERERQKLQDTLAEARRIATPR
jgi:hypothetical protein